MLLLLAAIIAVGILHTAVPDHWAPIAFLARQKGWSRLQTARVAAGAGFGHTISTLALGAIFWAAGQVMAVRYAAHVDRIGSLALITFGLWIATGAIRELRPGHAAFGHAHRHVHPGGLVHAHWHVHESDVDAAVLDRPHAHEHPTSAGTALMLVLGSSPSIEVLPVFFAAAAYGVMFVFAMAAVFAICTIGTYVGLSLASAAGLERLTLGPIERYGEVLSGAFVALVGVAFLIWQVR